MNIDHEGILRRVFFGNSPARQIEARKGRVLDFSPSIPARRGGETGGQLRSLRRGASDNSCRLQLFGTHFRDAALCSANEALDCVAFLR